MAVMDVETFAEIRRRLGDQAEEDIAWAEAIKPPAEAEDFALEIVFVICNSGMKNTVARRIYHKCVDALLQDQSAATCFGHKGKAAAIDKIWRDRDKLFDTFKIANDKLAFLRGLPWIGKITQYHLAKNFGLDLAKPDVHLQRLADRYGVTAHELCADLAAKTGLRIASVDTVIWRACANGIMNSRTGQMS